MKNKNILFGKLGKNNSNSLLLLDKTEISNVAGGMRRAAVGGGNSKSLVLMTLGAVGVAGLLVKLIGNAIGEQDFSDMGGIMAQGTCTAVLGDNHICRALGPNRR